MFEFLTAFVFSALALTILSAAGAIMVHAIFGPNLPPSAQRLVDTLMSGYIAGATGFLGPFKLLQRGEAIPDDHMHRAAGSITTLPSTDPKQITGQKQM